jgi:NAD(P)-dependent dehydrogenase (short-subunit alcohol dehydrogenase family)
MTCRLGIMAYHVDGRWGQAEGVHHAIWSTSTRHGRKPRSGARNRPAFLAASADVAICSRTEADISRARVELAEEFPQRRIFAMQCDVSATEHLNKFFAAAIETLGELDIVVNNVGVHGPIGGIHEIDWHTWTQTIAINLLGTVYSCRLAVRHFKSEPRQRRAKIINLSGGGATAPQPGLSAYGASKAAVVRFTETLSKEVEA